MTNKTKVTTEPPVFNSELNAHVKTASVTQLANYDLNMEEKTLYYLVIETPKGKYTLNVGEKTHNQILELTKK